MTADDLARFIAERLDEDEQGARATGRDEWSNGVPVTIPPDSAASFRTVVRGTSYVCGSIVKADAEHIARHDPTHILAFVAAGRAILELHRPQMFEQAHGTEYNLDPPFDCVVCWDDQRDTTAVWPCPTLRAFGAIWAGPAWREEWRA